MIDFVQELLEDKYWETIKNNCKLKEEQKEQDDMRVNITELPSNGLKIVMRTGRSGHSGVHIAITKEEYKKSCDYLILVPDNNHVDLYFIELKKTLRPDIEGVPTKACQQILSTVPIWDYLVSMIKIFNEEAKVIEKYKIIKHFVVIAENENQKRDKQSKKLSPNEILYKKKRFKVILHSKNIPMANLKCRTPS